MFSRIERPHALRHPVRGRIHALLEAEPGLHFQEIVRRLGLARGTVEHHLRKLVRVGLLVEQGGPGYTCYFPPGSIDRRVMAAVPILKSAGARAVLTTVSARSHPTLGDVAEATGLSAPTVTYHVRRLVQAGLLAVRRVGRETRVETTELGRRAPTEAAPR